MLTTLRCEFTMCPALATHYWTPVTKCVSLHSIYRTTRTLPTNHTVIIRPQSWEITYSDMWRFRIRSTKRPELSEPPRCVAVSSAPSQWPVVAWKSIHVVSPSRPRLRPTLSYRVAFIIRVSIATVGAMWLGEEGRRKQNDTFKQRCLHVSLLRYNAYVMVE